MNTNNKEDAIGEIEFVIEVIKKDFPRCAVFLQKAIDLLQDNEDTEDEEELAKDYICDFCGRENNFYHNSPKPSSKVEKLKELKDRVMPEVNILASVVLDLIDLIEDEE